MCDRFDASLFDRYPGDLKRLYETAANAKKGENGEFSLGGKGEVDFSHIRFGALKIHKTSSIRFRRSTEDHLKLEVLSDNVTLQATNPKEAEYLVHFSGTLRAVEFIGSTPVFEFWSDKNGACLWFKDRSQK